MHIYIYIHQMSPFRIHYIKCIDMQCTYVRIYKSIHRYVCICKKIYILNKYWEITNSDDIKAHPSNPASNGTHLGSENSRNFGHQTKRTPVWVPWQIRLFIVTGYQTGGFCAWEIPIIFWFSLTFRHFATKVLHGVLCYLRVKIHGTNPKR